jgi:hypothetical protein
MKYVAQVSTVLHRVQKTATFADGRPQTATGLPDPDRIEIVPGDSAGTFMIYRYTDDGEFCGDTWHESLGDAFHQAEYEYGLRESDFQLSESGPVAAHQAAGTHEGREDRGSPTRMKRPVTPEEAAVIQWLLVHPGPREPTSLAGLAVSELCVVATCDCGCRSVDFVLDRTGERQVRDACISFADGVQGGVILWAIGDALAALEFYDRDEGASRRVPTVSELRTWEQVGETPAE